ncbi:MAG: XdhC family protein [Acidimicrobiia bacterium]|nr:XdhC family protein [Acidimicrobiia bacterium]MDH3396650.1 XdhC family protein [Acidimicrobiia bacterium]
MTEQLARLKQWKREGKDVAFATVVRVQGSAPRPEGSRLLVSSAEELDGSVSGGCVENDVALHALQVLKSDEARLVTYGIADEDAFEVGLACGGTIQVYIEPAEADEITAAVEQLVSGGRLGASLMAVSGGNWKAVVDARKGVVAGSIPAALADDVLADTTRLMADEQSRTLSYGDVDVFIDVFAPPPKLLIFGAGPFAEPLCKLGSQVGYEVTLIDPRPAFAREELFPDAHEVIVAWPEKVLDTPAWDGSFVVVLNHNQRLEDPVIRRALSEPIAYLGVMGSRRTHADRLARLRADGWSAQDQERIHGPIGLDIGAETPAEVAVSILAEMTTVRYGSGAGESLKGTLGRIHPQRKDGSGDV